MNDVNRKRSRVVNKKARKSKLAEKVSRIEFKQETARRMVEGQQDPGKFEKSRQPSHRNAPRQNALTSSKLKRVKT